MKTDIELLQESIEGKWTNIIENGAIDGGITDCPLCLKYHKHSDSVHGGHFSCKGCPIFIDTGENGCTGTPYLQWSLYLEELILERKAPAYMVVDERSAELAQEMMTYLCGLHERLINESKIQV